MKKIFKEIIEINPARSVQDFEHRSMKILEELGEVSEAWLNVNSVANAKNKTWEDVREEAVDVAIVALDLIFTNLPIDTNKSHEDLMVEVETLFLSKLAKWRSNIEKQKALLKPGENIDGGV